MWQDNKIGTHIFDWDNKGKHVALAVARGLHFLHQNDVIHRFDRRPSVSRSAVVLPQPRWLCCKRGTASEDSTNLTCESQCCWPLPHAINYGSNVLDCRTQCRVPCHVLCADCAPAATAGT